ncbi:MAG: hypothetical protein WC584_01120 [Candidatus Pacearchaeota archaeon]
MTERDKKLEYIAQREKFEKKKKGLLEQIYQYKSAITKLHEQIKEARPRTEHGEKICTSCDCMSMKHLGRSPRGGLSRGDDIYECEICERDNSSKY